MASNASDTTKDVVNCDTVVLNTFQNDAIDLLYIFPEEVFKIQI